MLALLFFNMSFREGLQETFEGLAEADCQLKRRLNYDSLDSSFILWWVICVQGTKERNRHLNISQKLLVFKGPTTDITNSLQYESSGYKDSVSPLPDSFATPC